MNIVIGSERMGIWGRKYIDFILEKLGYTIKWENTEDADIIVSSMALFDVCEKKWNTKNKKYIYWSGESMDAPRNGKATKHLYISTSCNTYNRNNYIYVPYVLFSPYLYLERKYKNIDRPYLLAYCSSKKIKVREQIFDLFVKKKGFNTCHAYGACYGSNLKAKKSKVGGHWTSNKLIDSYKNYKFVLAMENTKKKGYVTEKILNAYYSGAIPIYYGSENVTDFFNPKSFINLNNFNCFEDGVEYVCNLSNKEIENMSNEPIYNVNNELINLFNDNYIHSGKYGNFNKLLTNHLEIFKNFLK